MRDLAALPKGHLHLHLEGGMRPSTLAELAGCYGMTVPTIRGFGSFTVFADMYVAACQVLRTESDLRRVVRECVQDAATAGAVWVEPSFYAAHHRERLGPEDQVLEIVLDEGRIAAVECGIGFGLMLAADRTRPPEEAITIAERAVRYSGQGVVSFGLANDEALFGPEPFGPAFDIAHEGGLLCTPHAGELAGPDSVSGALDVLHADRIQHGVRSIEDPELVKRLADEAVCLDVCPTSNILLGVYPSFPDHPLRQLLDAGVRCSLNGDDPLLFGPGLLEEYELCRNAFELSDQHLANMARSSIECSGAPQDLITVAAAGIDDWLS